MKYTNTHTPTYNVCLPVCLFEEIRIFTSLNHTSTYALCIRQLIIDKKYGQNRQQNAHLCNVQNILLNAHVCNYLYLPTTDCLSLSLYLRCVYLSFRVNEWRWCLFMFVLYIKPCLFRVGRRYDKTNVKW